MHLYMEKLVQLYIYRFLWKLKIYCSVHKRLWLDFPEVAVQSSPHPVSVSLILLLISHLCLYILSYLFSYDLLTNFYMYFLLCCIHAACPPNLILHDLITQIIFYGGLTLWSYLLLNFNSVLFLPLFCMHIVICNSLFSHNCNLCSSLHVRDEFSHSTEHVKLYFFSFFPCLCVYLVLLLTIEYCYMIIQIH
jgi:hypothetical protein